MWDETGQVAIVYNGEIFNYKEQRARLKAAGHGFKSDSDTEDTAAARVLALGGLGGGGS